MCDHMTFEYKSSEALLHLFLDALPPEAKTTPVEDERYFYWDVETAPERVLRWAIDFKSEREEMGELEEEEDVVESLVWRGISPSASRWFYLEYNKPDTFRWICRLRAEYLWDRVRRAVWLGQLLGYWRHLAVAPGSKAAARALARCATSASAAGAGATV